MNVFFMTRERSHDRSSTRRMWFDVIDGSLPNASVTSNPLLLTYRRWMDARLLMLVNRHTLGLE